MTLHGIVIFPVVFSALDNNQVDDLVGLWNYGIKEMASFRASARQSLCILQIVISQYTWHRAYTSANTIYLAPSLHLGQHNIPGTEPTPRPTQYTWHRAYTSANPIYLAPSLHLGQPNIPGTEPTPRPTQYTWHRAYTSANPIYLAPSLHLGQPNIPGTEPTPRPTQYTWHRAYTSANPIYLAPSLHLGQPNIPGTEPTPRPTQPILLRRQGQNTKWTRPGTNGAHRRGIENLCCFISWKLFLKEWTTMLYFVKNTMLVFGNEF